MVGFDYSQSGWYFVTICTHERNNLFGTIVNNTLFLNDYGKIVDRIWKMLPSKFPINLDTFQVMPNHIHGILVINNPVGVSFMKPDQKSKILKSNHHMGLINQTPTLGQIIRYFKSKTSYEIHKRGLNQIIWQRNYYEHIIRDEADLFRIREYTKNNPANWKTDKLF